MLAGLSREGGVAGGAGGGVRATGRDLYSCESGSGALLGVPVEGVGESRPWPRV